MSLANLTQTEKNLADAFVLEAFNEAKTALVDGLRVIERKEEVGILTKSQYSVTRCENEEMVTQKTGSGARDRKAHAKKEKREDEFSSFLGWLLGFGLPVEERCHFVDQPGERQSGVAAPGPGLAVGVTRIRQVGRGNSVMRARIRNTRL